VTPTPHVATIVNASAVAVEGGFALPVVWNCGGYESVEILRLLEGIVDVYMPDVKYAQEDVAQRLSGVTDEVARSRAVVREMYRQVGDLVIDAGGIARRGLLVRHLVLPNGLAGAAEIMRFLVNEILVDTYVNAVDQYRPCYRASQAPKLTRPITEAEFGEAIQAATAAGLHRLVA